VIHEALKERARSSIRDLVVFADQPGLKEMEPPSRPLLSYHVALSVRPTASAFLAETRRTSEEARDRRGPRLFPLYDGSAGSGPSGMMPFGFSALIE
jgi:hypothetical protein